MNINKSGILVLLVFLSLLAGPVSAANYNVDANMSNSEIQDVIDGATTGGTINFTTGNGTTYNAISLRVTNNNLKFKGNGVTLVGSGTSILTITNRTGLTIKDFFININSTTGGDGITGSNVYNSTIKNNVITNGDDAINIFMHYGGLKIINNTVTNMTTGRDGISLVNHLTEIDMDAYAPTIIKNNNIDDVEYGIWIGGNFKGNITGNSISATIGGLNITGRAAATNGRLYADILDNNITSAGIGIYMNTPMAIYINIVGNIVNSVGNSLFRGLDYAIDPFAILISADPLLNTHNNTWDDITTP